MSSASSPISSPHESAARSLQMAYELPSSSPWIALANFNIEDESDRLYRQIADRLSGFIIGYRVPPGTRLPAERELASLFGVSRPSVREALIALEVEGYVEIRGGSGVTVLQNTPVGRPPRHVTGAGPFDILKARWHFESVAASLAATNATLDQLRDIKQAVAEMRRESSHSPLATQADRRFHIAIGVASGNLAIAQVVQQLWEMRTGGFFMQLESHFTGKEVWRLAQDEHIELLDAIASRDPATASFAMQSHIRNAEIRLASAWSAEGSE